MNPQNILKNCNQFLSTRSQSANVMKELLMKDAQMNREVWAVTKYIWRGRVQNM